MAVVRRARHRAWVMCEVAFVAAVLGFVLVATWVLDGIERYCGECSADPRWGTYVGHQHRLFGGVYGALPHDPWR